MIRDNHLDAFITVTGYLNASIVEMASTQGAEVVTVAGAARDALIKKAPFYSKAVIPGGTYKGNDNDVETVAVGALWVSRNNIPEDVQYGVVKGLFGNKKSCQGPCKWPLPGKSMTLDTAFDGVPIPLCKGAERLLRKLAQDNHQINGNMPETLKRLPVF